MMVSFAAARRIMGAITLNRTCQYTGRQRGLGPLGVVAS